MTFDIGWPTEIEIEILKWLEPYDLLRVACINKKCKEYVSSSLGNTERYSVVSYEELMQRIDAFVKKMDLDTLGSMVCHFPFEKPLARSILEIKFESSCRSASIQHLCFCKIPEEASLSDLQRTTLAGKQVDATYISNLNQNYYDVINNLVFTKWDYLNSPLNISLRGDIENLTTRLKSIPEKHEQTLHLRNKYLVIAGVVIGTVFGMFMTYQFLYSRKY
jgi:hypothetical protein